MSDVTLSDFITSLVENMSIPDVTTKTKEEYIKEVEQWGPGALWSFRFDELTVKMTEAYTILRELQEYKVLINMYKQ